jgi:hypothetical protein
MQFLNLLLKIGGCFTVFTSVILLTASIFVYHHTQNFVHSASRAQGTVSKLVGRDGEEFLYPVFTFEDSQGTAHNIESLSGSYPAAYKVGDSVAVIYQPDKPENAEIDSFLNIWIWPIGLASFGTLNLLFGLGMFAIVIVLQKSQRKLKIAHAA